MPDYDVLVLGAGPGGYTAAIRASQLGMKAVVVESNDLGGICLNWGCIPSKALLRNAEVLNLIHRSNEFGITVGSLDVDFGKAIDRSREVVNKLTQGIGFLLKKNSVAHVSGVGSLKDPNTVAISGSDTTLSASNIIIATGASFSQLPSVPVDRHTVITSREALLLREVPDRIVIIGGGATGVEFAYLYRSYGSEVTLVELLPHLVPNEDEEVSMLLEKAFKSQGICTRTGSRVEGIRTNNGQATVSISDSAGTSDIDCDIILVAVGAKGNIDNIGLETLGVATERSYINIDDKMETNVPGVYAIGDVTGKLLLAHVASAQGVTAAETIAGLNPPKLDYELMPRATYCHPQIASFGLTETQAINRGHKVRIGKFPFAASGKALALAESEGMVKLIIDEEVGDVLGGHMIGSEVTELLGELSLARLLEGTNKELGWLVHPHPTISEVVKEAALAADGEAIHV